MLLLQNLVFWAALSGAVFPLTASAGEWEEYLALKEALTVTRSKLPPRPIPTWLAVREWEPRPHYQLESVKALTDHDRKKDRPENEEPNSPTPR